MDAAYSAADVAPAFGCSRNSGLEPVHTEESYVNALASTSLRMVTKGLPVEVQCLGVRMLQHLLYFRKKELNGKIADLRKALVGSLDDLVLKDATTVSDDPMGNTANPKENNKHKRCLLVMLAVNINSRSLPAMETNTVIGKVTGGENNLSPLSNITSNSDQSSYPSGAIWNETSCSSVFEDYDYVPFMNHPDYIGDIINVTNACKDFVEVAAPAMLASHQRKGSLLLMEYNVISQAFVTLIYYSRKIHQYVDLFPCLLSMLNQIWTLPEWRSKYLHHGSGLNCLFSDGEFLKMVHYMVRFCEDRLRRSCIEVFAASKSCDLCVVTFVQLILPLILEMLQCIHGLWFPSIACHLSEVLERAKYPNPTAKLFWTDDKECSQENDTRQLIEGIRESGYNVIGLCASIEGAFSWLLNRSVCAALSNYLATLQFRHLGKLIKLTVIPLVKNCPSKFWKEWVDNFLQLLLRHCEDILHDAWSEFLYHGHPGGCYNSYYLGALPGLEERSKTLERDILLEFTREVSGLLGVIAMADQSRALSVEDKDAISFQDSMPSNSLLRYLVINDCFGELRMSLFGYFVDDTATANVIPFCRSLISLAVVNNDARLRIFILDNLLPCLIQRLDNELPCAIQSLKSRLSSRQSDNARKGLAVLCRELYGYMLHCGYVETQALIAGDQNSDNLESLFELWLVRQKLDFRAKAVSAAAREVSFGSPWKWEFEDECKRYFAAYIDMLLEVDRTSEFAEDIYMDEVLFEMLSPEFRVKYAINSCVHPYMPTISSIQRRKFYSMVTVVRNRKICHFVRQLIKLKPYIKGYDRSNDVICWLGQFSYIPAGFYNYAEQSVELLLCSVLFFWEPRFHPMIREAHIDQLSVIVERLTRTECLEPLVPIAGDFPLHLQPYARDLIETKLKESKYYIAKQQTSLHEEFDEYLASGKLDDVAIQYMSSKDDSVEFAVNEFVPSRFKALEWSLIKLSFERRAEIVHMRTDICTYTECLRDLFSEPLKVQTQCVISQLEAENFFYVDSNRKDWGKASELVDKFHSELLSGSSLPKHYAIRALIDCRTVLLQKNLSLDRAIEKVVDGVRNSLTGYLQKFWKDTRCYEHQYYDIIRDPLKQIFSAR